MKYILEYRRNVTEVIRDADDRSRGRDNEITSQKNDEQTEIGDETLERSEK